MPQPIRSDKNSRLWSALGVMGAALLLLFSSAACLPRRTPVPLPTLPPTSTPAPSPTPTATWTPAPRPTETPTATPTPPYPITTVNMGETITLADLVMTVNEITGAAAEPNPETGRRFVLLDLTIQNSGERVVGISSARDLILKDGVDQIYRISSAAVAAIQGTTPDVDIAPGETIRAQAGFDVPAEASGLILSFSADKFGAGRVFIQLP